MESPKEKLDAYLESIGGLENGWRPDRPQIKDSCSFDCNEGWYPLIQRLIEDLIELGWDKQIIQVKEKFGGLRFYINTGSDEVHKRIIEAEHESYTICEDCGEPGELRKDLGWYFTLCDAHHQQKKEERNKNKTT
jgi:hypothetical protein